MEKAESYAELFKKLKELKVTQFESYISASQYLMSYTLMLRYAGPGSKILDWGTGTGHFSLFLLEQDFKVTGFSIENSFALAGYLKDNFTERYNAVSDPTAVKALPFTDNSFDIVSSIGVLEHVRETGGNETESLKEIKRILKPGGIFICYHLPNKYSWIEAISKRLDNKYHHRFKYSRSDVKSLFADARLEIEETNRYGILPRLMFRSLSDNITGANLYNTADKFLSRILNIFCQNHYIVGRNKS
jgi:ubiquinone/menaquinone biosynthesis C-methylase UbiE